VSDLLVVSGWFGERQRTGGRLYAAALLDDLAAARIDGSVLLRATAGFGLDHHLRGDQTLTMSEDPSLLATAIDRPERLGPVLEAMRDRQPRGLVTVERATDEIADQAGPVRMSLLLDRHERLSGVPAYVVACDVLRRQGADGASVLLGVDGTVAGERERARFFGRNTGVPTLVESVGSAAALAGSLAELREMLRRTTVAVRPVEVCKRDGRLLRTPDLAGGWRRLTVYTSESHLHEREPVHRAIVRRLRREPSRGVTVLRGIRGFHDDRPPHGDRLLQLGRRVPVVTTVVDTAEAIAAAFRLVDDLTREHGLVTVEEVADVIHPGR
jgi:PII-like signaling protein